MKNSWHVSNDALMTFMHIPMQEKFKRKKKNLKMLSCGIMDDFCGSTPFYIF